MTYNAAKAISDYVKPLCKNKYINDTISFAGMKRVLPLPDDEENVLIQRSVIIWMRP